MTREKFLQRLNEISESVAKMQPWQKEEFDASFEATNSQPRIEQRPCVQGDEQEIITDKTKK